MAYGRRTPAEPRAPKMKASFITVFGRDEVVFEENSRGREMYVIHSGRVKISKSDEAGHETVLAILESGEMFGEMALVDQTPRSAAATAVEDDTRLVVLDRARFMYYLRYEPEFALLVMTTLCERIREKNAQYARLLGEE